MRYEAPFSPDSRWALIDDDGTVLASSYQAPHSRLLELLGIEQPVATEAAPQSSSSGPAPHEIDVAAQPAAEHTEEPRTTNVVFTSSSRGVATAADSFVPEGEQRWKNLPADSPRSMLPQVTVIAQKLGLDIQRVRALAKDPDWCQAQRNGAVALYLPLGQHRQLRLVLGADGTALHLSAQGRTATAAARPSRRRAPRRSSATSTRARMPADMNQLRQMLSAHGFIVSHGGKHDEVRHPDRPGRVSLPLTPSDYRSIPNSVLQVRRTFGIDLRHRPQISEDH